MRLWNKLHELKNEWIQIAGFDGVLRTVKISEVGDDYIQYLVESRDGEKMVEIIDPLPQCIRAVILPDPVTRERMKTLEELYERETDVSEVHECDYKILSKEEDK